VVDCCGYAVGILTEPGKLATRAHLRADLPGALAQHALEPGLVDEQPPAGRQAVADPDIETGDDVRELAPGEIVHRNQRPSGTKSCSDWRRTSSSMPAARNSSSVRR